MTPFQRRILDRLGRLGRDATICPGQLARDCGGTLPAARKEMLALAKARKIVLSQQGQAVPAEGLRGPFRVRLR